jgi:hypothetical protein
VNHQFSPVNRHLHTYLVKERCARMIQQTYMTSFFAILLNLNTHSSWIYLPNWTQNVNRPNPQSSSPKQNQFHHIKKLHHICEGQSHLLAIEIKFNWVSCIQFKLHNAIFIQLLLNHSNGTYFLQNQFINFFINSWSLVACVNTKSKFKLYGMNDVVVCFTYTTTNVVMFFCLFFFKAQQ